MKKYIRTKTEIKKIETTLNNKELFDYLLQFSNYKDNLITVADTIEELCDEFVYKNELYKTIKLIQGETLTTILGKSLKQDDKVRLSNGKFNPYWQEYTHKTLLKEEWVKGVYGAIFTDKGLIYVAKMNDKGELELLWQSKNK